MVGIDNQIPNPHENTGCPGEAQPFPAWFTASSTPTASLLRSSSTARSPECLWRGDSI